MSKKKKKKTIIHTSVDCPQCHESITNEAIFNNACPHCGHRFTTMTTDLALDNLLFIYEDVNRRVFAHTDQAAHMLWKTGRIADALMERADRYGCYLAAEICEKPYDERLAFLDRELHRVADDIYKMMFSKK